jgi:hypothetical protein
LALKNFVGLPPDQLPFSAVKTLLASVPGGVDGRSEQRVHLIIRQHLN